MQDVSNAPGPTRAQIDAARTAAGGWTRETLAGWGIGWPPPPGWRARLIRAAAAADRQTIIRHNVTRVPPSDRTEIVATMITALNQIGRAMDESRAALASGDLDLVRQFARVIIDQASTIGTVGLP